MLKSHSLDMMAFMAQTWLIEPEAGAMLLAQLANGHLVLATDWTEDPIHYADPNWAYYPTAEKENSTAILNVTGVIYDYYVNYLCTKLDMIYADPNVSNLVVRLNGPGGAANAGNKLADKLLSAPIPTMGFVDYGMAASAHYMVASACDQIYTSRENDKVGSIGTYITYQNWSKQLEKMGVVIKELYARQSTQKNEESRLAETGDFSLFQKLADDEAARFIDYVKARRPSIDSTKQDPFKGRLFNATDALSIGLIDGIGDLKSAVKAVRTSKNSNTTPRTTMLGFVKLGALAAIKGLEASAITDAHIEALNTELAAAGYTGIAVCSAADFEKAVSAMNAQAGDTTALATAQADVTRLTTELSTEKTKATNLETALATAQAEVTRLGGMNGSEKTNLNKSNESQADAGADDSATVLANLPHNRALDGNPMFN